MHTFPQKPQTFFLDGPAGKLEVMTTWPTTPPKNAVGIICHPHPLYKGSMNHKVVTTIAAAFEQLGLKTVRFNFRGVGKSEGSYAETVGEKLDLRAILSWVTQVLPHDQIWLAGFSFGGYIAAAVANAQGVNGLPVKQLVTVAPAVDRADFAQFTHITCPWLIIQGGQDEIVPFAAVAAFAEHPPVPVHFVAMPEASHFFHRQLIPLREILMRELA